MDNQNWLSTVTNKSVSKTVVDKIKSAIISGQLKSGDYLPSESELAERFGVGKSSIREAIKMLEAIGVVEIIKGNGSRIREVVDENIFNPIVFQIILQSNESKHKLFEFRKMIEKSSNLIAMDNATKDDFEKLETNIYQMEQAIISGSSTIELDLEFHKLLFEMTHNPFMIGVGKAVMELFKPSLEIANEKHIEDVIKDHKEIISALKSKDKDQLTDVVDNYLDRWNKYTLVLDDYSE